MSPPLIGKKTLNFKTDVLRLVSGTGLAQIVTIISMPFLARYFSPEAFGIEALFVSLAGIFGVLACLRYEVSIVLPDDEREAVNLLAVSIFFSGLVTLLVTIFILLLGPKTLDLIGLSDLTPYLWLLPLVILINGFSLAMKYWNTRNRKFTRLSISSVTSAVVKTSGKLGAGWNGYQSGGIMIVAFVVGTIPSNVLLLSFLLKEDWKIINNISLKGMVYGIKRYHKFPVYGSWSILLGTGAWKIPVFLLGIFFSPTVVGFYALGLRMLQMPINLISSSIGQVFLHSITQSKSHAKLSNMVKELFEVLVAYSLFPTLLLSMIGQNLYIVFFGEAWAEAGLYVQIMSIWAFFWFISSAFTQIFSVLEKQELQLKWNVFNFISRLFAVLLGGVFKNHILAIWLLSIFGVLIYGYKVYLILDLMHLDIMKELKFMVKHFLLFVPVGCIILVVSYVNFSIWLPLIVAFVFLVIHLLNISLHYWRGEKQLEF